MKKLFATLALLLILAANAFAPATKSVTTMDDWAQVAAGGIREGTENDVSAAYSAFLTIWCCLDSTTAHEGTEMIVQVSSATSGDNAWCNLARFVGPSGTANSLSLAGAEAASSTLLEATNPAASNFNHNGKFLFLKDNSAIANSEVVYQTAYTDNGTDDITIMDGLTEAKDGSDVLYTVDGTIASAVLCVVVEIPMSTYRVRVVYNNNYDDDGTASTVCTKCIITKTTGL